MMLITVIMVAGSVGLLVVSFKWYKARSNRQLQTTPSTQILEGEIRVSDPITCRQVLACKGYNDTGAKNQYSDVRSRAIPNERLVLAFKIDNSFTTSEAKRRKDFNSEAINAIKMTEIEVGPKAFSSFYKLQYA